MRLQASDVDGVRPCVPPHRPRYEPMIAVVEALFFARGRSWVATSPRMCPRGRRRYGRNLPSTYPPPPSLEWTSPGHASPRTTAQQFPPAPVQSGAPSTMSSAWEREKISCGLATWSQVRERRSRVGSVRMCTPSWSTTCSVLRPSERRTSIGKRVCVRRGWRSGCGHADQHVALPVAGHGMAQPRRPEVQHVDLAAVIAARHPATLESGKRGRRRETADQRRLDQGRVAAELAAGDQRPPDHRDGDAKPAPRSPPAVQHDGGVGAGASDPR